LSVIATVNEPGAAGLPGIAPIGKPAVGQLGGSVSTADERRFAQASERTI
jgi:hypothetical protein